MASKRKQDNKGMSRGRFLSFLGKIGLLSLIPGLPAMAQKGDNVLPRERPGPMCRADECGQHTRLGTGGENRRTRRRIRGPMIRGKELSEAALTGALASTELERLRGYVTGQYYEKVGKRFAGMREGVIDWGDLGGKGIDSCVVATTYIPPDVMSGMVCIEEFIGSVGDITEGNCQGKGCPSGMTCTGYVCDDMWCSGYDCSGATCDGLDCSGDDFKCKADNCRSHNAADMWQDLGNFKNDIFVKEITDIFNTTDVGLLKNELIQILGTDQMVNLNVQHFINGATQI